MLRRAEQARVLTDTVKPQAPRRSTVAGPLCANARSVRPTWPNGSLCEGLRMPAVGWMSHGAAPAFESLREADDRAGCIPCDGQRVGLHGVLIDLQPKPTRWCASFCPLPLRRMTICFPSQQQHPPPATAAVIDCQAAQAARPFRSELCRQAFSRPACGHARRSALRGNAEPRASREASSGIASSPTCHLRRRSPGISGQPGRRRRRRYDRRLFARTGRVIDISDLSRRTRC